MSAKVKNDRGAWWVITHYQGRRTKKRIGTTKADRRKAQKIADEINARLALGAFRTDDPREQPLPFGEYAKQWFRSEVELPILRNAESALSPATAELHERHLRLYLLPFFQKRDVRTLRVAEVQSFYDDCLTHGRPPSARSVEMVIGTLRRILAYAEAREEVGRNAVEVWKRSRGRRRGTGDSVPANVLSSKELSAFLTGADDRYPETYPLILFLADTGARIGEALALRWLDLDLGNSTARIRRSFSSGKRLSVTKTGRGRSVELSMRLRGVLAERRPDLYGDDTLVFPGADGQLMDPHNFRGRVFRHLVRSVLGRDRRFTPHGLRHTFASIHMARGTPLKWIQAQGGWASAKVLLDTYGHYLRDETTGHADTLGDAPERPYTAPRRIAAASSLPATGAQARKTRGGTPTSVRPSWWARPDSNGGPPACKAGALTS